MDEPCEKCRRKYCHARIDFCERWDNWEYQTRMEYLKELKRERENRAFLEKIKTVSISSKATPTRGKK